MTVIPSNRPHPPPATPPLAKSALDRSVAALLLLLSGVCLLLIACALWLQDDRPVLTRTRRIGQDGQEFDLLRFRTGSGEASAPQPSTGLGRFLSRYHLDEVPVLVNVVKGDLSLVGPRPRPVTHPRAVPPLGVRPGVLRPWRTGTAPRSSAEEASEVRNYLRTWSPRVDLLLLVQAFRDAARGA